MPSKQHNDHASSIQRRTCSFSRMSLSILLFEKYLICSRTLVQVQVGLLFIFMAPATDECVVQVHVLVHNTDDNVSVYLEVRGMDNSYYQ